MINTNDKLRELIAKYELRQSDVVTLFESEYGTISLKIVQAWVQDARNMPGPMLELMEYKIKDALAAQQHGQG